MSIPGTWDDADQSPEGDSPLRRTSVSGGGKIHTVEGQMPFTDNPAIVPPHEVAISLPEPEIRSRSPTSILLSGTPGITWWIVGDQPRLRAWLDSAESRFFLFKLFIFIDAVLRGASQVMFANNSISGAIIIAALYLWHTWSGITASVGVVAATLGGMVFGDKQGVRDGLFGFNGILVGISLGYFAGEPFYWPMISITAVSCFFSVVVCRAVSAWFGPDVPIMTFPHNFTTIFVLASLKSLSFLPGNALLTAYLPQQTPVQAAALDSLQLAGSMLRGIANVYVSDALISGAMILFAILLTSPTRAVFAVVGCVVGTFTAVAFGIDPIMIYSGLTGYNAVLTMIAIANEFFPIGVRSTLLGVLCSIMSVIMWSALRTFFAPSGLPPLTFPFCLVTLCALLLKKANRIRDEQRLAQREMLAQN